MAAAAFPMQRGMVFTIIIIISLAVYPLSIFVFVKKQIYICINTKIKQNVANYVQCQTYALPFPAMLSLLVKILQFWLTFSFLSLLLLLLQLDWIFRPESRTCPSLWPWTSDEELAEYPEKTRLVMTHTVYSGIQIPDMSTTQILESKSNGKWSSFRMAFRNPTFLYNFWMVLPFSN